MTWREFAQSIPEMPPDEADARAAYRALLDRITTEVDEEDRELALSVLGDTWGEAARFNGWTLEGNQSNDDPQT